MQIRATSRATPSSRDGGEGEAQFPHGTWSHCEAPPCVESAVHAAVQGRGVSAPLPYTESHATLHYVGDVGEARCPLSHRWTDTSPILPDTAHDGRSQGRVVSLSVLSLLSACVRFCQLREVHHSLQQALNPWSRTQSAGTDGSPACCTSCLLYTSPSPRDS